MMGRITFDVPLWQNGIIDGLTNRLLHLLHLDHRKDIPDRHIDVRQKPSWKEMLKWAFRNHDLTELVNKEEHQSCWDCHDGLFGLRHRIPVKDTRNKEDHGKYHAHKNPDHRI